MSDEPIESNPHEAEIQRNKDWENRILCSDESCIGVIGPDGRCKECGKPYNEPPAPEPPTPETQTARTESAAGDGMERHEQSDKNDDWEKRTLCSDESCIGVIGPDGRCKECGKVYQG